MKRRTVVALALSVTFAVALLVWGGRTRLAEGAIDRALASRGITASYSVKNIGARWQRIENVRIGDPRQPDLTADWAEVRLSASLGGVAASAIRAGGVRLSGRIVNGRLSLGALDRLLPKSDGSVPFALPDLDLDLVDARVRLDTPWGRVGARLDGSGNLQDGFSGRLAAVARTLGTPDCAAQNVSAYVDVSIRSKRPVVNGPLRAVTMRCAGVVLSGLAVAVDATLDPALDAWRGKGVFEVADARGEGVDFRRIVGRASFTGTARDTRLSGDIAAAAARYGATRLAGLSADGRFSTGNASGEGRVGIERLIPDRAIAASALNFARATAGTPLAPLVSHLASATAALDQGIKVGARVQFAKGTVSLPLLDATSQSGARLQVKGGSGLRLGAEGFLADTNVLLSGGGFPTATTSLRRTLDGKTTGIVHVAPYGQGDARLVLGPLRFAAQPSGAALIETFATLDGPLAGGRVEGLATPLSVFASADGKLTVNRGCAPLSFRSLSISGLQLAPASVRVCPLDDALLTLESGRMRGGASVAMPRISGRIGTTPIALAATRASYRIATNELTVDALDARIGTAQRLSQLAVESLSGRIQGAGIAGRFAGASGQIGNVPLKLSDASGTWLFRQSALSVSGKATVTDAALLPRFNPLVSNDVGLRLAGGTIRATATLRTPKNDSVVTRVTIAHDLAAGVGNAVLDVASVRFGKTLQPEDLTPLTIGVIANVQGALSGRGDIRWNPQGVTSSGHFATDGLDLAAAFGPVTGLKGEIIFNDLLALATPPGQQVTIATVNPGTPVTGGVVRYQLLPGQRVAIERGIWPFAGGELILEPTTLDLGRPSERALTFRVVALDAAKFIERMEFENLSATGTFDGVIPMIFDENGGRIEGGSLIVRKPGGTLAYVGEVSNAKMNVYAKLAFDALKSIRYQNLTISLDGPLDGEIVSKVNFNGINEAPLSPPKSFIARQFIGLPFRFNITIRAPFRSLLNTARTFQDPSSLIQRTTVQPSESEPRP